MKEILACSGAFLIALSLPRQGLATAWEAGLVGERSAAMANAYAAVADTPECFHANPAGLATIRQTLSVSMGLHMPTLLEFSFKDARTDTTYRSSQDLVAPHVFAVGRWGRWALGLGYTVPIGGGGQSFKAMSLFDDPGQLSSAAIRILVHNLAPSLSVRVHDTLYLGASFNTYLSETAISLQGYPYEGYPIDIDTQGKGTAFGTTVGVLFKEPWWGKLSFGFTYKMGYSTRAAGKTDFDIQSPVARSLLSALGLELPARQFPSTIEIRIPQMLVAGVAAQLTPRWLIAFDYQYSMWGESEHIVLDFGDEVPTAVEDTGLLSNQIQIATGYRHASQFKLGTEWKLTPAIPLRAGLMYQESAKKVFSNSPVGIDSNAFLITYGSGYGWHWGQTALSLDLTVYHYLGLPSRVTEKALGAHQEYWGPAGTYNKSVTFGFLAGATVYTL